MIGLITRPRLGVYESRGPWCPHIISAMAGVLLCLQYCRSVMDGVGRAYLSLGIKLGSLQDVVTSFVVPYALCFNSMFMVFSCTVARSWHWGSIPGEYRPYHKLVQIGVFVVFSN